MKRCSNWGPSTLSSVSYPTKLLFPPDTVSTEFYFSASLSSCSAFMTLLLPSFSATVVCLLPSQSSLILHTTWCLHTRLHIGSVLDFLNISQHLDILSSSSVTSSRNAASGTLTVLPWGLVRFLMVASSVAYGNPWYPMRNSVWPL